MRSAAARLLVLALVAATGATVLGQSSPPSIGGALPPLFPADNWWNQDVSAAPLAAEGPAILAFINNGGNRRLHPDFGGYSGQGFGTYGIPYVVVAGNQPKRQVSFYYPGESDGVGVPFYPIPDQAITQPYWIEGGPPGNQNPGGDRHMLIVDADNQHLYELFDLRWNGSAWTAGSGAFFDLQSNARRPEGWTSADAAGLAILPGLVRYDEVFGPDEITHALRVTVRATNSFYVWPASHKAGSNAAAPPLGTRLRMKASKDISGYPAPMQKIFRAMKRYGLIVADNGSDMYVSGAFDPRWDNDVLNPAFHSLYANDFEVVQLGWRGAAGPPPPPCAVPAAPTNLWSTVTGHAVTLAWTTPAGSLAGHRLDVGSGPGLADLASFPVAGAATSFAASAPAGRYHVRVRAASACGVGPSSNEIVLDVPSGCGVPTAPGTLVFSRSARTVSLAWGPASGAVSYVLEAGYAPGASNAAVLNVSALGTGGTVPPATYYVRVRGRNGCGQVGPATNEVTVVVP